MKKLFSIFVTLLVIFPLWAGNVITYTATSKLGETTSNSSSGLHTNAFNVSISSHTFSNGTGAITFSGEVTSIGSSAFYGCKGLTSVTIGNSVTSIGNSAFSGCSGLTLVTIPNSVTSIGWSAFFGCSGLTSVIWNATNYNNPFSSSPFNSISSQITSFAFGDSVQTIPSYLCYGMPNLTTVTIPNSVTSIEDRAFYDCPGLTLITIPNSVTSIGNAAFYSCSGLTLITIPNSVTSIGGSAFSGCSGLTSITIPNSVTSIGSYAFSGCSGLTSITIPDGVTSIENYVFDGCSGLTSITIPNSVTSIGWYAFQGCSGLTSVTIGNSVTSIGDWAFNGCSSLTSITIPNSVTSIGERAFFRCSGLTSITIGNSVTSIGERAFSDCSGLTSITIPNSVTSIGSYAFSDCSGLTSVTIGNSVTSIGNYAFEGCSSLTSITIPDGVTSIGNYAFRGCTGLISVTIGNGVTRIGSYAFDGCSGLNSITIPNIVTSIGSYAFRGCSGLTSITMECETPPSFGYGCFDLIAISKIYVPCGTLYTYKASASTYAEYFSYLEDDFNLTLRANMTFGTATITSIPNYCANYEGTFSATANYGYHFTQWSDGNTDNPRTITLTSDTTFTAEFAKNEYTLVTTVSDSAMGVAFGDTTAFYLDTVLVSAKANYGYHFVNWSDGSTKNSYQYILKDNTTLTATFAKNSYIVRSQVNDTAMGSVDHVSSALYLDEVTFTATANFGYHFVQWSDGVTDNPRMITLASDTTLTAEFAKNEYTLVTTVSDSLMGVTYGDTTALYLDTVLVSAKANYGYHFVKWDDGILDNPRSIVLTQNTAFQAEFAKNIYNVTSSVNDVTMGSVDNVSSALYLDEVTFTATANFGYEFKQWNDGNTDNPRIVYLESDTSFVATFYQLYEGECGENLTWRYTGGTLYISGTGAMYDFTSTAMPWLLLRDSIETVSIDNGATSIGNYAFYGCQNRAFRTLTLPQSIVTIGDYAFANCNRLTSINFSNDLEEVGDYAFSGCTRINDMTIYATITPDAYDHTFAGVNTMAYLYVLPGSVRTYRLDPIWGVFDIQSIGAETTTVTTSTVEVVPSDNEAVFTWPTNTGAASYSLTITKDGIVFCTLTFNANGQLTGIAFAPGRNGAEHAAVATTSVAGMTFTVTGLDVATAYAFSFDAKNASQQVIESYTGTFETAGYKAPDTPTDLEHVDGVNKYVNTITKVVRDGQVLIQRGDRLYDLRGQKVK